MEKSEERILESYKILQSVKGTAKDTGYSWNRVVKALSSNVAPLVGAWIEIACCAAFCSADSGRRYVG